MTNDLIGPLNNDQKTLLKSNSLNKSTHGCFRDGSGIFSSPQLFNSKICLSALAFTTNSNLFEIGVTVKLFNNQIYTNKIWLELTSKQITHEIVIEFVYSLI